jgi:segregation and condensation protein A
VTPTISVSNFEGPLGLLLELAENGKLEVTSISVGDITRQYLQKVTQLEALDHKDMTQFIELGVRLVYIKSLALLPDTKDDDEPIEQLQRLNEELAEYKIFKQASLYLNSRLSEDLSSFERRSKTSLETSDLPLPKIDLIQLEQMFNDAILRTSTEEIAVIKRHHFDQKKIAQSLLSKSSAARLSLKEVFSGCNLKDEVIVTFLAVLDLIKSGLVEVTQSSQYGDLFMEIKK